MYIAKEQKGLKMFSKQKGQSSKINMCLYLHAVT